MNRRFNTMAHTLITGFAVLFVAIFLYGAGLCDAAYALDYDSSTDSSLKKPGDKIEWSFSDGTLTLSGSGNMYNYNVAGVQPWSAWNLLGDPITIKKVVIQRGITGIGRHRS